MTDFGSAPTSFKDRFSTGSANYAAYRPHCPIALIDALADISLGHTHALDCGCRTGPLSALLAERLDTVVATDANTA